MARPRVLIVGWLALLPAPAGAQEPDPDIAAEVEAEPAEPSAQPLPTTAGNADQLARLIAALTEDASYKVRLQAAVFLGRSGSPGATEPLIRALEGDEHYTVRAAAVTALANLGYEDALAEIFEAAAVDAEPFVREEALRALHKYHREVALPYAVAAFGSRDLRVRELVVRFLAEDQFDGTEVVLLRALGDEEAVRAIAGSSIRSMEPAERLRLLESAAAHRDPGVRQSAVNLLNEEGTPAATQIILGVYDRDIEVDPVRAATRTALRHLREHLPIQQIVHDATSSNDKHARAHALKLLGVIGGAEAHDALIAALENPEVYLRGTAVMALRELGDPSTIPELEKLLREPENQRIAVQIRTAVKHLRKNGQD